MYLYTHDIEATLLPYGDTDSITELMLGSSQVSTTPRLEFCRRRK